MAMIMFNIGIGHAQDKMISVEKELTYLKGKEASWFEKTCDDKYDYLSVYDSASRYDSIFTARLVRYLKKYPSTVNWPFKKLSDKYVSVLTSSDSLFRIYSWDNDQGGTCRSYTTIIQFKDGKGVSVVMYPKRRSQVPDALFYDLLTVKTDSNTFYVVAQHIQQSSYFYNDAVKAFSIVNGKLNDETRVFKTKNGMQYSISYDWKATGSIITKEGYRTDNDIEFVDSTRTVKIPVVLENDSVTTRFIKYRFTGKYFEKVKE
jgi:hypothetical protein